MTKRDVTARGFPYDETTARLNDEANALLNRAEAAEAKAIVLEAALRRIANDAPPPWMSADYQQFARDVLEGYDRG